VKKANLFWANKKVLITGHTGFKGSWLSVWLHKMGAQVTGLSLAPATKPNLFELTSAHTGIKSVIGNVGNYQLVQEVVAQAQPEIIFHMAAQALVGQSYIDPVETYSTNVLGTVHVLEAARQTKSARAIVNVTTDKCYLNKEWLWGYRENDQLGGHDPYSSSKACSELVASAYSQSFFQGTDISLATARAGNVIGGGDWTIGRLLPDILFSFETGTPLLIRNPKAVRPWQHVLEPLSGYLLLAQRLYDEGTQFEGAWNFGPYDHDTTNVEVILQMMSVHLGVDSSWQLDSQIHAHETAHLRLDISKAIHSLGWQPRWSLAEALEQLTSWHKAWMSSGDMYQVCLAQIAHYQKSLSSDG
jgi:CDP-glucose 4,6-dehydratase